MRKTSRVFKVRPEIVLLFFCLSLSSLLAIFVFQLATPFCYLFLIHSSLTRTVAKACTSLLRKRCGWRSTAGRKQQQRLRIIPSRE